MHANSLVKFALAACCLANIARADDLKTSAVKDADYYPLKVGSEWRYHFESSGHRTTLVSRVAKFEEIDGLVLARVDAEVDGQIVATEHLRVTDEGVFRHRYNGSDLTPPVCILKFPIRAGDTWQSDNRLGQDEFHVRSTLSMDDVEVPYGKFAAVKVVVATAQNGMDVTSTYWFAPGVGNVKQLMKFGDKEIPFELFKFKPGE